MTIADDALYQMRHTHCQMLDAADAGYDLRATTLALQLNTQALVTIAELLDEMRHHDDDEHSWHAPPNPDAATIHDPGRSFTVTTERR
jgi:hypothetical protein